VLPGAAVADYKHKDKDHASYRPSGNCAELVADGTTEFHGRPASSKLLAMAGKQWVVFNKVIQACNERRASNERNAEPYSFDEDGKCLIESVTS